MEELQQKLNQARAEFHQAVAAEDSALEDATWAKYMDLRFAMVQYKKNQQPSRCHLLGGLGANGCSESF